MAHTASRCEILSVVQAIGPDADGRAGNRHVRVAFTATDERIEAAVTRLTP